MESDEFCSNEERDDLLQGYTSIPYGLQLNREYVHPSKHCDFRDVIHNTKTHDYIILDSRGVSSWKVNALSCTMRRLMEFEAYQFNTLRSILYSRFYNVYFALTKEYGLKVYNLDFLEVCSADSDGTSVSRLLYNNKRNELITVCRSKIRFWNYSIRETNSYTQGIFLLREFDVTESLLLSNAEFDNDLQRIYLLCDSDIYCYSNEGRSLFHLKGQSSTYISAVAFSKEANLLIAGSITGQLSIYNPNGGLVTTLLNHSRIVTAIVVHPTDGNMFLSASMDGTIKLFSLHMLGEIYSINAYPQGVMFMKVQSKSLLYVASRKGVQLYNMNYSFRFWSTTRCPVRRMNTSPAEPDVRPYVVVFTTDYSIRLYSKMTGQRRSTILPPPEIAIGSDVLSIAFDRLGRAMYVLFKPLQLWIYSTRTDPATRVATWNLELSIKESKTYQEHLTQQQESEEKFGTSTISQKQADENIGCCSLLIVRRDVYESEKPLNDFLNFGFLMCGLSNGSVCLLDPCQRGSLFKSFKAHSTSPVKDLRVDYRAAETHLLTLLHTIEGWMVRIWDAVTLKCFRQVSLQDNFTQFTYKNFQLVIGHSTGHLYNDIIMKSASWEEKKNSIRATTNQKMKDHDGSILSVDISEKRNFICSCGEDSHVRIWNSEKVLLNEIKFDNTLKYAVFLNVMGSVLISFKSQLFIIPYYVIFNAQDTNEISHDYSSGEESVIFEDPLVKSETLKQRTKVITTLANYLVPYPNLGLESLWMNQGAITDKRNEKSDDERNSVCSDASKTSLDSFASTAIYQDSSDGCLDEELIRFPRCDHTPEPRNISLSNKNNTTNSDNTDVENGHYLQDEVTVEQPMTTDLSKMEIYAETVESLYDRIRKRTTDINSTTTSTRNSTVDTLRDTKGSTAELSGVPKPPQKKIKRVKKRTIKTKQRINQETSRQVSVASTRKTRDLTSSKKSTSTRTPTRTPTPIVNIVPHKVTNIDAPIMSRSASSCNNIEEQQLSSGGETESKILPRGSRPTTAEDEVGGSPQPGHLLSLNYQSPHHRSLLAMATGKSERLVSHSYQNVMKSLMKTTESSTSSVVHVSSSDDEDSELSNGGNFKLHTSSIGIGYEADSEATSTLDIRGRRPCPSPSQKQDIIKKMESPRQTPEPISKMKSLRQSYYNLEHQSITDSPNISTLTEKTDKNIDDASSSNGSKIVYQKKSKKPTTQTRKTESKVNSANESSQQSTADNDIVSVQEEQTLTSDDPLHHYEAEPIKDKTEIKVKSSTTETTSHIHKNDACEWVKEISEKSISMIDATPDAERTHSATVVRDEPNRKSLRSIIHKHFPSIGQKGKKKRGLTGVILDLSVKLKSKRLQEDEEVKAMQQFQLTQKLRQGSSATNGNSVIDVDINNISTHDFHEHHKSTPPSTHNKLNTNISDSLREQVDENNNFSVDEKTLSEINSLLEDDTRMTSQLHAMTLSNKYQPEETQLETKPYEAFKKFDDNSAIIQTGLPNDLLFTANAVRIKNIGKDTKDSSTTQLNNEQQETRNVMQSFILSSFRKPQSPVKKERVQFKLSEEETVEVEAVESDYMSSSSSSWAVSVGRSTSSLRKETKSKNNSEFITPKNSYSSMNAFSPVTSVTFRQQSPELTSDDSAVVMHDQSELFGKLRKHRLMKQKERNRQNKVQTKRSVSSGYDTASRDYLLESELPLSKSPSSASSFVKQRLSIKRSPLSSQNKGNSKQASVIMHAGRNSEVVYYDDYLPGANPFALKYKPHGDQLTKEEKIRNLEKKLSGQRHRYHSPKVEEQLEADRLALMMLKTKTGGVKVPVKKNSPSIPSRCHYKRIPNSHQRRVINTSEGVSRPNTFS